MDILCLKLCMYSYVEKYIFIHSFIVYNIEPLSICQHNYLIILHHTVTMHGILQNYKKIHIPILIVKLNKIHTYTQSEVISISGRCSM